MSDPTALSELMRPYMGKPKRRVYPAKRRKRKRVDYGNLPYPEHTPTPGAIISVALPLPLAPTTNEYAALAQQRPRRWKLAAIHKQIAERIKDAALRQASARHDMVPRFEFKGSKLVCVGYDRPQRRRVVVTRHSSAEPDELAVDVIGGKVPVDGLVKKHLLVDDDRQWCVREALWRKAAPKRGMVIVEVFPI